MTQNLTVVVKSPVKSFDALSDVDKFHAVLACSEVSLTEAMIATDSGLNGKTLSQEDNRRIVELLDKYDIGNGEYAVPDDERDQILGELRTTKELVAAGVAKSYEFGY